MNEDVLSFGLQSGCHWGDGTQESEQLSLNPKLTSIFALVSIIQSLCIKGNFSFFFFAFGGGALFLLAFL